MNDSRKVEPMKHTIMMASAAALVLVMGCTAERHVIRGVQSATPIGTDSIWYVTTEQAGGEITILRCTDDGRAPFCQVAERIERR
jgi:hypothetical protein